MIGMSIERWDVIRKIRCVADYQFGRGIGEILFPDDVELVFSKRTGRVRYIYLNGELLATLRPSDGLFSLAIGGAKRILKLCNAKRMIVKVRDEAAPHIRRGRNVFAKHVLDADDGIHPQEEVIVVNRNGEILAVGRALLTGREMKTFRRGVAVKVRKGVEEV